MIPLPEAPLHSQGFRAREDWASHSTRAGITGPGLVKGFLQKQINGKQNNSFFQALNNVWCSLVMVYNNILLAPYF